MIAQLCTLQHLKFDNNERMKEEERRNTITEEDLFLPSELNSLIYIYSKEALGLH